MSGLHKCASCGFASRKGDKATGRCQNALNDNYARPLWAVSACDYTSESKSFPPNLWDVTPRDKRP